MRDPDRIDRILDKVEELWRLGPDLRLGQLIENAKLSANVLSLGTYNVEDDILERGLDNLIAARKNNVEP